MAVAFLTYGVISTTAFPQAVAEGAMAADRSGATDYIATGAIECNYSTVAPWFADLRYTRCRVLIDGEDAAGLIGPVQVDEQEDAIARTASFRVLDPRACFWNPTSITRGGRSVEIYQMCDDHSSASEELVFKGVMEAGPNDGPYCPETTVRCLSLAGSLLNATTGCVQYPAFSSVRRRDVLIEYALSAGVVLTLPDGIFTTVLQKPVNVSGVSIEALILRYCAVEGLYCREQPDGSLEFFEWTSVGPDAARYLDVTEDMYVGAPKEDPPNRPVTVLTVAGSGIAQAAGRDSGPQDPVTKLEEEDSGTDSDGHPWTRKKWVTRWYGVEIKSVREDQKWYARNGASADTPALRLTQRLTTTTDYTLGKIYGVPADGPRTGASFGWQSELDPVTHEWRYYFWAPTARVNKVTDVTEGWFSPFVAAGAFSLWTDGSSHLDVREIFQETGRTVTTYTYNADTCRLAAQLVETMGWYTPLVSSTTHLFDDGTYRADDRQVYQAVSKVEDKYSDNLADAEAGTTSNRTNTHTTATTSWITTSHATIVVGGVTSVVAVESYALGKLQSVTESGTVGASQHTVTDDVTITNGPGSYTTRTVLTGPVGDPQTASDTTPQFTQVPLQYTLNSWTNVYPVVSDTMSNDDAESVDELRNVALREMRKALAVRETFNAPAVITLRALHPISFTDSARELDAADCHVEKLTRVFDTLNAWCGMQVTAAIEPAGL